MLTVTTKLRIGSRPQTVPEFEMRPLRRAFLLASTAFCAEVTTRPVRERVDVVAIAPPPRSGASRALLDCNGGLAVLAWAVEDLSAQFA